MLISASTAPDRALGPESTAVNASFIKVLPLNQLSGLCFLRGPSQMQIILAVKVWLPGHKMMIGQVS